MNRDVLTVLGYPRMIEVIQSFAQSEAGRRRLNEFLPAREADAVQNQLELLREGCKLLAERGRHGLAGLGDPLPLLEQLEHPDTVFDPAQLLEIRDLLQLAGEIRRLTLPDWPLLSRRWDSLDDPAPLLSEIDATLEPTGELRESADPELGQVRRRGTRAKRKLEEKLSTMLSGKRSRFLIDEPFVTQRNDRFVIPVKVEHQKSVPGLIHGTSSSGATVFLEPMEAVDLNNEWIFCREREKEIIHRLLVRLTKHLRTHLVQLRDLHEALADFDALQSRAAFAEAFDCTVPFIRSDGRVKLSDARHPLLLHRLGREKVVPLSLELGGKRQALVISGPNAGGKTVVLKTVGLLALMAQSGLPVPAREAEFPLFHQILADIGDRQSIAADLSTFSAHVLQIRSMAADLHPPSLVLLDELGTGTDPAYGAALGIAILEHFQQEGVLLLATTHHRALKQFAESVEGITNASVTLDPETLRPTYRLHFGVSGESSAFEIAEQLGLPASIVHEARDRLDSRQLELEAFLKRLREEERGLQSAREETEQARRALQADRERLQADYRRREEAQRKRFEDLLESCKREFEQRAETFIRRSQDRAEAARLRSQAKARAEALRETFRRKMARESDPAGQPEAAADPAVGDLKPGDSVYDDFFQKKGKLLELQGENALVEVDGKRLNTSLKHLRKLERRQVVRQSSPQIQWNVVEDTDPELNLIGLRVQDALEKADKYLDRAFVSRLRQVRLVHGFGTGRLKEALQDFLAGHPHVKKSQVEGGSTVVDLRL